MTSFRFYFVSAGLALLAACGGADNNSIPDVVEDTDTGTATGAEPDLAAIASVEIVPGLTKKVIREGTGDIAEVGDIAVVHYTGWLFDETAPNNRGTKFDSSRDRGQHFEFPLGGGRVIRGWDAGVVGMQVGELRELTIAPEMAYGDRQVGAIIGPDSTLVFEVELANLKGRPEVPDDNQ